MKINKNWMIIIVAILAIAVVVLLIINFSGCSISGTTVETNETQTITYLEKNKEIALVTLGVTDILDQTTSKKLFGKKVAFSDKKTFMKATFEAKLGIDGKDVKVTEIGEKEFEINIPKFVFIGYSNPKFEHIADNNGVLSFLTEDIDQAELINKMLDEKGQEKYISQYTSLLKESAEEFYNNLIPSFDKGVKLSFKYEE
jgi:hypothetical protein